MDPAIRVIDYVREGGEVIHTAEGTLSASVMLERFLFPPDQQYSYIEKLSGGERRRLYLLRILMEAPNVLFLDEPTGALDEETGRKILDYIWKLKEKLGFTTLTLLEDYLDSFDGIVVAVSHDRYFLDRITTRIFAYEGNGVIKQYEGNYSDYLIKSDTKMQVSDAGLTQTEEKDNSNKKTNRNNWKDHQEKKLKMSYKEQREFETIEDDIATLEEKVDALDQEILKYANDFAKLNELSKQKEEAQNLLSEKMDRWVYLEELAAKISKASY